MIFLVIALLFAIPGVLLLVFKNNFKTTSRGKRERSDSFFTAIVLFVVAMVLFTFGSLLPTGVAYMNQLNARASLTKYDKLEVIYTKRANDLTARFTAILGVQYPAFEKAIFEKIGPAKKISAAQVDAYMVAYPELKTSSTLVALVEEIRAQRDLIYQQQTDRIETQMKIHVRTQNPWLLTCLLP